MTLLLYGLRGCLLQYILSWDHHEGCDIHTFSFQIKTPWKKEYWCKVDRLWWGMFWLCYTRKPITKWRYELVGKKIKTALGVYISNSASDIFKWFEKLYRCSKVGVWACALVEFNVAVVNLAFLLSFANIAWLELRKCSPFYFQHFEVVGDVLLR